MVVHRIATEAAGTPYDLCLLVLRLQGVDLSVLLRAGGSVPMAVERNLGSLPGWEVIDQRSGTVVRAGLGKDGEGYAISLIVQGNEMGPLYRLFDRTCASVDYRQR